MAVSAEETCGESERQRVSSIGCDLRLAQRSGDTRRLSREASRSSFREKRRRFSKNLPKKGTNLSSYVSKKVVQRPRSSRSAELTHRRKKPADSRQSLSWPAATARASKSLHDGRLGHRGRPARAVQGAVASWLTRLSWFGPSAAIQPVQGNGKDTPLLAERARCRGRATHEGSHGAATRRQHPWTGPVRTQAIRLFA